MIVNMSATATEEQIHHVMDRIKECGFLPHLIQGAERTVIGVVGLATVWVATIIVRFVATELTLSDIATVLELGCLTLVRVVVLIGLATSLWVPGGVYIGLRPKLAERLQPLAQFRSCRSGLPNRRRAPRCSATPMRTPLVDHPATTDRR